MVSPKNGVVLSEKLGGAEFGRRHGWVRASREFTVQALAGRKPHSGIGYRHSTRLGEHTELFDHHYCYREAARPYRAAAVVANLYNDQRRPSPRHPSGTVGSARPRAVLALRISPQWWLPRSTALALIVAQQATRSTWAA